MVVSHVMTHGNVQVMQTQYSLQIGQCGVMRQAFENHTEPGVFNRISFQAVDETR